ncbi:MAG TPA: J domain-containing protein [Burkholderiales bacterium]|nr:J domain-containing protein [Burkholderiales bacterium]
MSFDYYATLGVSPDAPPEVIRAAYRVLAQKHHPDRHDQSKESEEITVRINEAYRVLSDPVQRAAYDGARQSSKQIEQTPDVGRSAPTAPKIVEGEAEGVLFKLRFIPGTIIANDIWIDTRVTQKRVFNPLGFGGVSTGTEVIPKQRIGVRVHGGGDIDIPHTGSHIPAGAGEEVQVVQVSSGDNGPEKMIALVNHALGQWFWIDSELDAGVFVRPVSEYITDFILYVAATALVAAIIWMLFVREGGSLIRVAFLVFAVPMLFRFASPVRFLTAYKIGRAIRVKITEVVAPGEKS